MDKFIEDAFKKAVAESAEVEDAERAWMDCAMPALLAAERSIGPDRFVGLVRALSISRTEDMFFECCQTFFYAGFSCGRGNL